jgi:hypothetical protein
LKKALMIFCLLIPLSFPAAGFPAAPTDLNWSTLLGGSGHDRGQAIALDEKGYLYVAGRTASPNFPTTPGAYDASRGTGGDPGKPAGSADTQDLFIVKLHPSGSGLVYAALLGGSRTEDCGDIALDGSNNLCLTGTTWSEDFPVTAGALQTEYRGDGTAGGGRSTRGRKTSAAGRTTHGDRATDGGDDEAGEVFVTKLNAMGTGLIYSTLMGGREGDRGTGIALDSAENIYLTGWTRSPDFPATQGAFDGEYGGGDGDAFAAKLDVSGKQLIYATFLGGPGADRGNDIAVDRRGRAWVAATTEGQGFPVTAVPGDTARADDPGDACLVQLNPDGSELISSTRLGGSRREEAACLAVDPAGRAYLAGWTRSPDFPATEEAFDRSPNHRAGVLEGDGFVARLDPQGKDLLYATYLGGPGPDRITGMALDAAGSISLCGWTEGGKFPTTAGFADTSAPGRRDVFFAQLDPSGAHLVGSALLGGRGDDQGADLVLDTGGNVFLTGWTESADFPIISQSLRSVYHGGEDAFAIRLGAAPTTAEPVSRGGSLPNSYALFQNYPNPFNSSTVIRFDLPREGRVTIRIFDTLGREKRLLLDRGQKAGGYIISWNGRDNKGKTLSSGVYFCKLEAGGFEDVIKMVMMR